MKKIGFITLLFISSIFINSCIFDDDPLSPNQLPQIVSYRPESQAVTLQLPTDSVLLKVEYVDPNNDPISYIFLMSDSTGRFDSVLSYSDSVVFYARVEGIYNIQGRAYDNGEYSKHDWFIRVKKSANIPPIITEWVPGSQVVQYVIGTQVDFSLQVEDDHPDNLFYGYKIGGSTIKPFSKDPVLSYRFLENGNYNLKGIVWDGEYGDTISWNITISGFPDTIPPNGICDLTGHPGSEIGSVSLEWTTPGDDGMDGYANGYVVRTSTIRILSELEWNEANDQAGEPMPLSAGEKDSMTLTNLHPGEMVYACLRAYDEFDNLSPVCSSPHLRIRGFDVEGKVINGGNSEGIEGIAVLSNSVIDISSADGSYKLENLTLQSVSMAVKDEFSTSSVGDYYDYTYIFGTLSGHLNVNLCLIPAFTLIDAQDERYSDFLDLFKVMTSTTGIYEGTVFKGWDHWPVKVYSPQVFCDGVDLQAAAEGAMEEWENMVGFDLFQTVESLAEADVEIYYDSTTVPTDYNKIKHHVETVAFNQDGTPSRKLMFISTLTTTPIITNDTHVIYAHEFGHVLGLFHSVDDGHLMIGLTFPSVDHVSTDEANLVKVIYNMPPIFNSEWIARN